MKKPTAFTSSERVSQNTSVRKTVLPESVCVPPPPCVCACARVCVVAPEKTPKTVVAPQEGAPPVPLTAPPAERRAWMWSHVTGALGDVFMRRARRRGAARRGYPLT